MNKSDYPVRYFPLVNEFDNKLLTHFFNFLNSIPPDCVVGHIYEVSYRSYVAANLKKIEFNEEKETNKEI